MDEDQAPSSVMPQPRKSLSSRLQSVRRAFTTRRGILGDYDYAYLFRPNIPFLRRGPIRSPFFGLNDHMPVVLALLLGFQHSLAMLAGIITPPLIISGPAGANLAVADQQYLVSAALIISGILSTIQITRFKLFKSPYYLGTGLISVVGISFNIIPIVTGVFPQMYKNGFCPSDDQGNPLPCPRGYGALIGTSAVCALIEILISFIPARILLRICPPIVTGPTVMLIGIHLIQSGFQDWMGGAGLCTNPATAKGIFELCPTIYAPHALPWGSAEYLGLGFAVFVSILLCERFGAPIMRSTSVAIGLLIGCIIAAACGYFDQSGIDAAPVASFLWIKTFPLSVYGPLVLPVLAVYIICAIEATGDITATCDVSKIEVDGPIYESRVQGGILADGLGGVLSSLMTMTPMSVFAQNNGVIALTRCANRKAGYACCFFLVIMGIFSKFAAAIVAIPSSVIGGMTTFLFCSVAVSGISIIARGVPFTRRNRFILTAGLCLGYGATLVPSYFDRIFTYQGDNKSLRGFLDAIVLVMETGFCVTALICMILNLTIQEEEGEEYRPGRQLEADEHQEKTVGAASDNGEPPASH
ncbi:Putative Purine permease [[Torrubiella] hemipterigena]|uniref:Putative Purine permease n=1 Tax=[Torrubiella] hemipterigena TaxID=1531966 RepID=A0A0A1SW15_9HYPO|nr:Putative Purine permease [[Torrubiella] hemipterigena]